MTGPSIAVEPSAARIARTALPVLNERCVNSRWKPTVIPSPVEHVHDREHDQVAPAQQRRPHLPGDDAEGQDRQDGDRPGQEAVEVLVGDGLDVVALSRGGGHRGASLARHRKFGTSAALRAFMKPLRRLSIAIATASAALALTATPSMAIVGGHDAAAGAYPSVAEVHLGKSFLCTGTLVAPDWVLTAGHCGSITGSAVATPVSFPPALIDVYIGSNKAGQGERVPVAQAIIPPDYLATQGYDITLLKLSRASSHAPTQVAGAGETASWAPGTMETIVGWGATSEGGDTPDTLQEAQVPVTTDAYCARRLQQLRPDDDGLRGLPAGRRRHLPGRLGRPDVRHDGRRRAPRGRRHELRRGLRAAQQARRLRARRRHDAARVDPLRGAGGSRLVRLAAGGRCGGVAISRTPLPR